MTDVANTAAPAIREDGKHPLSSDWTMWWDRKVKSPDGSGYEQGLVPLGTFDTLEDFFKVYAYVIRPPNVPKDTNLQLFRGQTKPLWENFASGGCWFVRLTQNPDSIGLV
eukprot:GABW01001645.1.p2 GENE.GABW01001645.1~~GABW01001645.1.p2  ORF type:complete len:110 (-),score=0.98 GABW01001645.1:15-344(-)